MLFRSGITNPNTLTPWTLDTETFLIAPGRKLPRGVCFTYAEAPWDYAGIQPLWDRDLVEEIILPRLKDPQTLIVGQNIAYDLGVLADTYPHLLPWIFKAYVQGRVSCTKIRERLILLARGEMTDGARFSMDALWKKYTGEDISQQKEKLSPHTPPKAWRLRFGELYKCPLHKWPLEALQYAKEDATRTGIIWEHQTHADAPCVRLNGRMVNEEEQAAADFCLLLMGAWGFRTDAQRIAAVAEQAATTIERAKHVLVEAGLYRREGTELVKDTKAIRNLVTVAYDGDPPLTDKEAVCTDKDTLQEAPAERQPTVSIGGEDIPILQALASISTAEHNLNQYLPVLEQGVNRPITPDANVLLATGRASTSKPAVQVFPRSGGWRECIVPQIGRAHV